MSKRKESKVEIREIVYSGDDEKSFGDIFIYEPENVDEQKLGNLFIVGEMKDLPRSSSYLVNLLASKIKKEFYANTKRSAEESLEAGLAEANRMLGDLADQGNGEYLGKLSMVCGTYQGGRFHMSQVGRIRSLLVRGGQLVEIIKEEAKPASLKRAFNNIASGELEGGDLVLLATGGLFDVFSTEKLRKMASAMKLDQFASEVQERVEEAEDGSVSALVLEVGGGKKEEMTHSQVDMTEEVPAVPVLAEAVEEEPTLVEEESLAQTAEEVPLAMEEAPVLQEAEPAPQGEGEKEEEEPELEEEPEPEEEAEEEPEPETAVPVQLEKEEAMELRPAAAAASAGIAAPVAERKISLGDIIKEYEKMESRGASPSAEKDESIRSIIERKRENDFGDLDEVEKRGVAKAAEKAGRLLNRVKSDEAKQMLVALPKKVLSSKKEYRVQSMSTGGKFSAGKKVAVVLGAIVLFVFVLSPALFKDEEKKQQQDMTAAYQAKLAEAQAKLDEADLAAVGGGAEAGQLYFDAKALALEVKDGSDAFDSQAEAIIGKAQTELDEIDKVVRVENVETLASFTSGNPSKLTEMAGTYYLADGAQGIVYKMDVKNGSVVQASTGSEKLGALKSAQGYQNAEVLLIDSSAFLAFATSSTSLTKVGADLGGTVQDMTVYGRNIYVLSPAQNQIYKFQKSGQALSGKSAWLKSGEVSQAVSMAIDSNIYVLSGDGTVSKYYTGEKVQFAIEQPSESLAGATKIFTQSGQKQLYILDGARGRIAIYDKESGKLLRQLTGDGFTEIKDITVDAKETAITALMSGKVVKINL